MASKNVSVSNLVKIYRGQAGKQVTAVNDVSLSIEPGEFITLLGPSGCGKTTILRMVAGFEKPTSGSITIGGEDVTGLTPDKRDTAMVFQSYALFPHLNVADNIGYGLSIRNLSKAQIKEKVAKMLALVGLSGLEGRFPNQLSGGQQQRVALARSLVMEPSVLLFDEPLSNLDAKLRIYMRAEIRKLQQKVGITSVYVTHDQAEAMSMSDRIVVMNNGVIEQIGSPREIYNYPSSQFVADFIGMANIVPAKVEQVTDGAVDIELLGRRFRVPSQNGLQAGDTAKAVLRPEAVRITQGEGIPARIESSVFMGNFQDYRVRAGEQLLTAFDYHPADKKVFNEQEQVALSIQAADIHLVSR